MTDKQRDFLDILFTDTDKINAFYIIAEKYYFGNFGSISKSDFETLLFHFYYEQIINKNKNNIFAYNDYEISKQLGITQNKVSNLKVKNDLMFPKDDDSWRNSFEQIVKYAHYDGKKIKIYIPDKPLFLKLKNLIEINGGYVDIQLNTTLLQITPQSFIALMADIFPDIKEKVIKKEIKNHCGEDEIILNLLEKEGIAKATKRISNDIAYKIISNIAKNPVEAMGTAISIFETVSKLIN